MFLALRFCSFLAAPTYHVMWSRGIIRKLNVWHLQFSIWLKSSLGEVQFAANPTWIGPVVPKLWQLNDSQNNRKQKKMHSFFWQYLTTNAADFRLIPLDCNTYFTTFIICSKLTGCTILIQIYYAMLIIAGFIVIVPCYILDVGIVSILVCTSWCNFQYF